MPPKRVKQRPGSPDPNQPWVWGESNPDNAHAAPGSVNPFRGTGQDDPDSLRERGRAAAAATTAAQRERQANRSGGEREEDE